jgi:bloom syndrome protein
MGSGLTIVISPLVSLIQDQIQHLREANVNAACLSSSQDWQEQRAVMDRCDCCRGPAGTTALRCAGTFLC